MSRATKTPHNQLITIQSLQGIRSTSEKVQRCKLNIESLERLLNSHLTLPLPSHDLAEIRHSLEVWRRKYRQYKQQEASEQQAELFPPSIYWLVLCAENSNFKVS